MHRCAPLCGHRDVVGALRANRWWCMRFDRTAAPPSSRTTNATPSPPAASLPHDVPGSTSTETSPTSPPTPPRVSYCALPESMYPKHVQADFTPFPLPKHDASLGFGPVRLRNVPDIEAARARMAAGSSTASFATQQAPHQRQAKRRGSMTTQLLQDEGHAANEDAAAETAASMLWAELSAGTDIPTSEAEAGNVDAAQIRREDSTAAVATAQGEDANFGGYHVHPQFPLLDVLECGRSVEDLLEQFRNRPQREARAATVLDFASTLQRRSNDELARIFYELSSIFTWDGNGLQFLVTTVGKFGRGYAVTSELTKAFVQLVDAMTLVFVEEQPQRLAESPPLLSQVLHFLALVKILEPNRWYSFTQNAPQNRADYKHPFGVNNTTAYQMTGQTLVGFLEDLVSSGYADGDAAGIHQAAEPRLMAGWTVDNILDVLAGFSGIMPDGKAPSNVVRALLDALWQHWSYVNFELTSPEQAAQLERLYMLLQVMDIQRDAVLDALLGGALRMQDQQGQLRCHSNDAAPLYVEREDTPLLRLSPALSLVRGPDFFSAVSRDKRPAVKAAALEMLERSLTQARSQVSEAAEVRPSLHALIESGYELLQSLDDKELARAFARREKFDVMTLEAVPHMTDVAAHLAAQEAAGAVHWSTYPLTKSVRGGLPDTPKILAHLQEHPVPYLIAVNGVRAHPIRTVVANLDYIKAMDNVFLLHSSGVATHVERLVSAVRRLRSGKDALLVTSSCLRALQVQAHHSRTDKMRQAADRALEILACELVSGRAILLPLSEELYVHDAATYCDEDLMLWTVAAYLARDLPLVKVHTIISGRSAVKNPHHMMQPEFSPMSRTSDLYNPSTPLLQSLRGKELRSVTRHATLQRPVKDRRTTIFNVSPVRSRFVYRRDKALFDKYHVTARNLAPGFSQGALASDLRGLGFYTPDHPQVPYTAPATELMAKPVRTSATKAPLP